MKVVAVLTTDIVHSTKLTTQEYNLVIKTLKTYLAKEMKTLNATYEIYRGDSFQIYFPNILQAMRASVALRLYFLSGLDCPSVNLTQSFALGEYEQLAEQPGTSVGEAFVLSGRALDQAERGAFVFNLCNEIKAPDLLLSTRFLNHLFSDLTEKQSAVLFYYVLMEAPEQKSIAKLLNITRQNVATHLKRGGAELIKAYIDTYEGLVSEILNTTSVVRRTSK